MPPYKAVFLDAWETIWYNAKDSSQIWSELLPDLGEGRPMHVIKEAEARELGFLIESTEAFDTSGRPNDPTVIQKFWEEYDSRVLTHLGIRASLETVRAKVIPRFREMVGLFPDTKEVLQSIKSKGYLITMVSNGVGQEDQAARLGISEHFDTIIGSAYIGYRKPMPEIYQIALDSLKLSAGQVVMVGDDWYFDVRTPQAMGISALLIERDEPSSQSSKSIKDLWGLVEFLEKNEIE